MKTIAKILALVLLLSTVLLLIPSPKARQTDGGASTTFLTIAGVKPVGDRALNDAETTQLNSIFSQVVAAANSIAPGADAGVQRRAIDNELRAELESFVTNSPASAWTPSLHLLCYIWWRFESHELPLRECLQLAGEAADAGCSRLACESIFDLVNRLESGNVDEEVVKAGATELLSPLQQAATEQWEDIQSYI